MAHHHRRRRLWTQANASMSVRISCNFFYYIHVLPTLRIGLQFQCRWPGDHTQNHNHHNFPNIRDQLLAHHRTEQSGFTPCRSTIDRISTLNIVIQSMKEFHRPIWIAFVDLKAAFDSVDRKALWKLLNTQPWSMVFSGSYVVPTCQMHQCKSTMDLCGGPCSAPVQLDGDKICKSGRGVAYLAF